MSADFWAGYLSGAVGIVIGNPLDIVKVQLQRPSVDAIAASSPSQFTSLGNLVKGTTAPVLGYGALNALLFMTYNRSMSLLAQDPAQPTSLGKTWMAGAVAGLATFVVSAPTELVKCRAQVSQERASSFAITKNLWREGGIRALYLGGTVTSMRDSIGYGFYFWSYELSKRALMSSSAKSENPEWMSVLLCGGIAGVVTWASVFPLGEQADCPVAIQTTDHMLPLDVIKTRVQTQDSATPPIQHGTATERSGLLHTRPARLGAVQIAQQAYQNEGLAVFFRGLGVCSIRAFFVNAVQWAVYEWMMHVLLRPKDQRHTS
ncbi:hypothetical protein MBLNU459_g4371t1 [Dothideomycetes sp. NU459]